MQIRFLSKNKHKVAEVAAILGPLDVQVVPISLAIEELQTDDMTKIVRDKTLKAFAKIGQKLIVEQTGLLIDHLNGFPGGLTQVFWDSVGADRVCELFGQGPASGVVAKTRVGYCDGRKIHQFEGEIRGTIAPEPRGDRAFQWDCVFIPEGHDLTFAEMGDLKNEISMRRRALDALASHIREHGDA